MLRKILKLHIKTETNVSLLSLFWKEYVFFYILKAMLTPFHIWVQAISFMAGKALPNYITCTWTMQPFKNSVALVRTRTIPTELLPPVG